MTGTTSGVNPANRSGATCSRSSSTCCDTTAGFQRLPVDELQGHAVRARIGRDLELLATGHEPSQPDVSEGTRDVGEDLDDVTARGGRLGLQRGSRAWGVLLRRSATSRTSSGRLRPRGHPWGQLHSSTIRPGRNAKPSGSRRHSEPQHWQRAHSRPPAASPSSDRSGHTGQWPCSRCTRTLCPATSWGTSCSARQANDVLMIRRHLLRSSSGRERPPQGTSCVRRSADSQTEEQTREGTTTARTTTSRSAARASSTSTSAGGPATTSGWTVTGQPPSGLISSSVLEFLAGACRGLLQSRARTRDPTSIQARPDS